MKTKITNIFSLLLFAATIFSCDNGETQLPESNSITVTTKAFKSDGTEVNLQKQSLYLTNENNEIEDVIHNFDVTKFLDCNNTSKYVYVVATTGTGSITRPEKETFNSNPFISYSSDYTLPNVYMGRADITSLKSNVILNLESKVAKITIKVSDPNSASQDHTLTLTDMTKSLSLLDGSAATEKINLPLALAGATPIVGSTMAFATESAVLKYSMKSANHPDEVTENTISLGKIEGGKAYEFQFDVLDLTLRIKSVTVIDWASDTIDGGFADYMTP